MSRIHQLKSSLNLNLSRQDPQDSRIKIIKLAPHMQFILTIPWLWVNPCKRKRLEKLAQKFVLQTVESRRVWFCTALFLVAGHFGIVASGKQLHKQVWRETKHEIRIVRQQDTRGLEYSVFEMGRCSPSQLW